MEEHFIYVECQYTVLSINHQDKKSSLSLCICVCVCVCFGCVRKCVSLQVAVYLHIRHTYCMCLYIYILVTHVRAFVCLPCSLHQHHEHNMNVIYARAHTQERTLFVGTTNNIVPTNLLYYKRERKRQLFLCLFDQRYRQVSTNEETVRQ